MMGQSPPLSPDDRRRALQALRKHGPLTSEAFGRLMWPDRVVHPLVTASCLAHLIDRGWVIASTVPLPALMGLVR